MSVKGSTSAGGELESISRAEAEQQLASISQKYEDDIDEFWRFAHSLMEGISASKKRAKELEHIMPGSLGSVKRNPDKLERFPHSLKIVVKILLVYEIVLFEEMVSRYKRFMRKLTVGIGEAPLDLSKTNLRSVASHCAGLLSEDRLALGPGLPDTDGGLEERVRIVGEKLEKLSRGYQIRNLVVHNSGVMDRMRLKKCGSICSVGEEVPLRFDLVYDVHDGLTLLNECLMKGLQRSLKELDPGSSPG